MTIFLQGSSSGSANLEASNTGGNLSVTNLNISGTLIANSLTGNADGLIGITSLPNINVFSSPGTFSVPSTTNRIKVTVIGGGSGGTGANGSSGYVPGPGCCTTSVYGGAGGAGGSGGVTSFGSYVTVGASTPGGAFPLSISNLCSTRGYSNATVGGAYGITGTSSGYCNEGLFSYGRIIFATANGPNTPNTITTPNSGLPGYKRTTAVGGFLGNHGIELWTIYPKFGSGINGTFQRDITYTVNFPYSGFYLFRSGVFKGNISIYVDGVFVFNTSHNSYDSYQYGVKNTVYVNQGSRSVRIVYNATQEAGNQNYNLGLTISTYKPHKGTQGYSVYLQGPFPPTIPVVVGAGGAGGGGGSGISYNVGVPLGFAGNPGTPGILTTAGTGGNSTSAEVAGGAGGGGGGASGHTITAGGAAGTKGTSSWSPSITPTVRKTGSISAGAGSTGSTTTIAAGGIGGQGDYAWSNTTCPVGIGTNPINAFPPGPSTGGAGGSGGFSGIVIVEY